MSASKKIIKDCSDCQQEIELRLKNTHDWEVNKKEILNDKIQNEPCLKEIDFNLGHRGSIDKALEKYKTKPSNPYGARVSVSPMCNNCGATWQDNEYGDETGDKSLNDGSHDCQSHSAQSNQIKSNQIKSNQIKSNQIKSNQIKSNSVASDNKTNYLPWILGGIGTVSLIGLVVYFLTKKKGGKNNGL